MDSIAQRYGCLPSVVLTTADTLDLLVLDMARSYETYRQEKSEAERTGRPMTPQIPLNKLQEMMDKVKR